MRIRVRVRVRVRLGFVWGAVARTKTKEALVWDTSQMVGISTNRVIPAFLPIV